MFKLEIETDGAAFRSDFVTDKNGDYVLDPNAGEVRRILHSIYEKLSVGYDNGKIIDVNGNCVGEWRYE